MLTKICPSSCRNVSHQPKEMKKTVVYVRRIYYIIAACMGIYARDSRLQKTKLRKKEVRAIIIISECELARQEDKDSIVVMCSVFVP